MESKKSIDYVMFTVIFILIAFGIIMVFSASTAYSYKNMNDAFYFFRKQILYAIIGSVFMFFTIRIDYHKWGLLAPVLLFISIVFLGLVLMPGIGMKLNGARRWINLFGFNFQPSELLKFSTILFLSFSLSQKKIDIKKFWGGLFPYLFLLGFLAVLLIKEPHLSCAFILVTVSLIMILCAGAKIKHYFLIIGPIVAAFMFTITFFDYAKLRILSYLDPFKYEKSGGYQVVQSLIAIGTGGFFGKGLGKSMQKYLYIPEPHNDFIFAVLAEEFGFIGVITVFLLFFIFVWRGIKIALRSPDLFGSLLAVGITLLVAIQTILNIAVVTASFPNTGISLPFFSAGGSSLMMFMALIGILLNISKSTSIQTSKVNNEIQAEAKKSEILF